MSHLDKVQPVIKNSDMSVEMQKEVEEVAKKAIDYCNTDKEIATFIKDDFRSRYHGTWHCIVGRNFGSFVTFERSYYIYLYVGQLAILLFKTG
ncbi:cytoplasmic dynein light chain 2 (macronuclear) [Tetrahymena thermophila SB210]|uniref:Dynein light chain 8b n=3 Tax=Tetrahymena thermophila TaxID=5911 RepID=DYL8B_TETTS|nr:cytoplasmic dynein light chain 2 [Tetrahymena thermophila SB210]6ZYW_H Chain H, Dynein light chain [Tetrahymena thermophila SB210]7KEK_H Chain H, Dynein light chain LC8_1b (DLC82) [Tetrahymena thermophila]7MOQ_H Chain H, Dynein light chain [Tetrahymena thermophila CU428]8BWY_H Chain H, Dynein light chain [Chlamydomonas reinhardtii]8BX8_H Chain H, Dynein light chain [Tetrahymena thermophila]ABF38952.1 dynein light chain 8-like B [Tetrahymena thermophila]EDK31815.2 cytoplasmic dynein light |eukprot:XP_001471289.2 cytoplasmic dynein light chain 2 [Tetrahymena thermophila SB210]